MVLQVTFPNLRISTRWIEKALPRKYGLKDVPLFKYFDMDEAAEKIGVRPEWIRSRLIKHKKAHALYWGDRYFIHPDSFIILAKEKYRQVIMRELKR